MPDDAKGLLGICKQLLKRTYLFFNKGAAQVIRLFVALIAIPFPSISKIVDRWTWLSQPVFGRNHLNKYYKHEDPFGFASPYEIGKYEHTIKLLSNRHYGNALETGAAEGIFTEMLAPLCDRLTALEIAEIAVERGKKRTSRFDHVDFIQGALPNDLPQGSFDLIILSDVLIYFPKEILVKLLKTIESQTAQDGIIFCLHYLGNFGAPLAGLKAQEIARQTLSSNLIHEERVAGVGPTGKGYDILVFQK